MHRSTIPLTTIVALLLLANLPLLGGEPAPEPDKKDPPPEAVQLPDVNVTAARGERNPLELPYALDALALDETGGARHRSLPELMAEYPGVLPQKTGHGQGSPFIRGFTGFHTLLLVDGIRLNNSVFRAGPNQYWGTVDTLSVDRMELVRGPSSVLYGSDAVGGTVNAVTLTPTLPEKGQTSSPQLLYRWSGAEGSHTGRVQLEVAEASRGGVVAGLSSKTYGDLIGGNHVGRMEKTGYLEVDADVKAVFTPLENLALIAAVQHVSIADAWRTHKTIYGIAWHGTTVGNEKRRVLDQQRDLGYLRADWKGKEGFLRRVSACLSYHVQQEERERIKASDARDVQGFDVGTVGFSVVAEARTPVGRLSAGLEHYHDGVNSFARTYDSGGALTGVKIQGPVGDDANYDLFGAFLQDELPLGPFFEVTAGLRFTWASAFAGQVEDPVTGNPVEVEDRWSNLSGSLRVLFDPGEGLRFFAGASQGFRAPNLSDLTRLDSARSDEIETPSPSLDPETFLSLELGTKASMKPLDAELSLFYTFLFDGIVRFPTGRMIGSEHEVTKANVGDGYVYGVEARAKLDLGGGFEAAGSLAWMEGMQDTYDGSRNLVRDWMSRLAPLTGRLRLGWEDAKGRLRFEGEVVAAGRAEKLSLRDQSDTQRIPPGGTPGYGLINFRVSARASDAIRFFASAENVTNADYRVHGSGLNGPGTNLVLGVELALP
ncbi:MAG: TonB-dependent receptor [Planctomycetota bacterium]